MSHLQKNLSYSIVPSLIQTLGRTEKFLFSSFHQRSDTRLKYLLKNIIKKNICKLLRFKFNRRKITVSYGVNWTPFIKANTSLSSKTCAPIHYIRNGIRINYLTNSPELSEKYVLCIGGRSRLYPEYRCLIESLGGNMLIYRGNQQGDMNRLPTLLNCADMVVCPVDCVNHETYFAVKYFCNKSGKPCVLLDRSDLPTFRKGIEILTGISI